MQTKQLCPCLEIMSMKSFDCHVVLYAASYLITLTNLINVTSPLSSQDSIPVTGMYNFTTSIFLQMWQYSP